ncbi:MAG TPA: hypothetical protein VFE02_09270 [Candidatus Acidoferrales bacterium]|jgi:hypothetical protein|nr:hypothetical protein [Candidatus Acidoferrales bacterium]
MDFDLKLFIATHATDILMTVIYSVKVLFVSHADLRTKLISSLMLFAVIVLGRYLRIQMAAGDTSMLWTFAVSIGIRLIALKIIFGVLDSEPTHG